jgi:hypothetical protein
MSILFPCAELRDLKRRYASALRKWGLLEFPLHNEPLGSRAEQLDRLHLKLRAMEARNEAGERVLAHQEKCRVCKIEVEFVKGSGRPKARVNRFLSPTDTKYNEQKPSSHESREIETQRTPCAWNGSPTVDRKLPTGLKQELPAQQHDTQPCLKNNCPNQTSSTAKVTFIISWIGTQRSETR